MPLAVFKRGSKGPFVAEIQKQLNIFAGFDLNPLFGNGSSLLPPLDEDGKYGKKTADRVKEFQKWNPPLKVDGKVGPNTWAKLTGKFWSPEVAKGAQEAAPAVAAAPEPSAPIKYFYLLDAANHTKGELPRRSGHAWEHCEYVLVQQGDTFNIANLIEEALEGEGKTVQQMVLLAHSSGAGHLSYGGNSPYLGGSSVSLFRTIKPHLAPGAVIWIFGCAFATSRINTIPPDYDTVQFEELLQTEGGGIAAMKDIARFTGCEVRAGFTSQTANLDSFTDFWCAVWPTGTVKYYLSGRGMTPEHLADYALKGGLMSSILAPVAYGLWGWDKTKSALGL